MMISCSKLLWSTTALSTIAIALSPIPAHAYQLFFGEDLNNNQFVPLRTTPKATTAQADFLGNLVKVGTADFENLVPGTSGSLQLNLGTAGIATLQGGGRVQQVRTGRTNGLGRYAVSGQNYWEADASGNDFSINFSQSVAAFGFHGVDIGDFGGILQLNLALAQGGIQQITVPNTQGILGSTDGSVLYFGLIAEGLPELFTGLSFDMNAPGDIDIFVFDNMTIGSLQQVKRSLVPKNTYDSIDSLSVTPLAEGQSVSASGDPQAVPEPGSILVGFVCMGVGSWMRSRKQGRSRSEN